MGNGVITPLRLPLNKHTKVRLFKPGHEEWGGVGRGGEGWGGCMDVSVCVSGGNCTRKVGRTSE